MRAKTKTSTATIICFALFLVFNGCKGKDNKQVEPQKTQKFNDPISESAEGTKLDSLIVATISQRDSIGAEKLKTEYFDAKKKKKEKLELEKREISDLLTLDIEQPKLHLQFAESDFADFRESKDKGYADQASKALDNVRQELEWFNMKGIPDSMKDRISSIRKGLPEKADVDSTLTKNILAEAHKTFQSGKALYIYYPENRPIEFDVSDSYTSGLNAPTTYIRYIRSPQYPPGGCRVVTYMFISRDGKEPKEEGSSQGYEACVLPTGELTSFCIVFGIPKIQSDTKLFIHVESLFHTKGGKEAVIISNTIAIPVVAKKK